MNRPNKYIRGLNINLLAFTLAEVLITLGIIGVIAAITIPVVIGSSEKQVIVSKVKEAYSIISQATNQINNDCNGDIANCLTTPSANHFDSATNAEVANLYKQKLSVVKDCGINSDGCFPSGGYKYLDNIESFYNVETTSWFYKMTLANGMSVAFVWNGPTNPLWWDSLYIGIYVDINGISGPNMLGKDFFWFVYDRDSKSIKPVGPEYDTCVSAAVYSGEGCAEKVIQQGAVNYY